MAVEAGRSAAGATNPKSCHFAIRPTTSMEMSVVCDVARQYAM